MRLIAAPAPLQVRRPFTLSRRVSAITSASRREGDEGAVAAPYGGGILGVLTSFGLATPSRLRSHSRAGSMVELLSAQVGGYLAHGTVDVGDGTLTRYTHQIYNPKLFIIVRM